MSSQASTVIESFWDADRLDGGIDILTGVDADVSKKRAPAATKGTRFNVEAGSGYDQDLEALDRAYYLAPIFKATDELKHQALTRTRNRKPLDEPLVWCLEATWELRVGIHKRNVAFRVLYRVDDHEVRLLRLMWKEGNQFVPVRKTEDELAVEAEEGGEA